MNVYICTNTLDVPSIACNPDLCVSRCGVCLRLQGITSARSHVALSRECARCDHSAVVLAHKLSEGLTTRLRTNCRSLAHTVSEVQLGN